jgi:hypothetical protein
MRAQEQELMLCLTVAGTSNTDLVTLLHENLLEGKKHYEN